MRKVAVFFLFCGIFQVPAPCQQVTVTGYSEQDVVQILNGITQHLARLQPMLEQVRAKDWAQKGASETYAMQYNSAQTQLKSIQTDLAGLATHTDNLQDGMKDLFKLQAFHRSLTSVMEGLRKYQNPALADLVSSVAAEDQTYQDKLQYYLIQLATDKDAQYQLVDKEAQRCRALLSRQPAPAVPSRTKR